MQQNPTLIHRIMNGSIVLQIVIGLLAGIAVASVAPDTAKSLTFLGSLFVKGLKAVAPVLVFVLVASAIANKKQGVQTNMRPVLTLYLLGTFLAAVTGVLASFAFPTTLQLVAAATGTTPPGGIGQVLNNLVFQIVDNPINAIATGNYIGILTWAVALGMALHHASDSTKTLLNELAEGVSRIVGVIIRFAPIGVFGLVAEAVATTGLSALLGYSKLLLVLVGAMLFIALVVNPLIVGLTIRRNPFPLVFTCLRRKRCDRLLYPQLGGQHPGKHEPVQEAGPE
ncbi:Na+/serine symporter [Vogesella perlucida]|nr:Na+/serine symporter [Vogesella perlucida]